MRLLPFVMLLALTLAGCASHEVADPDPPAPEPSRVSPLAPLNATDCRGAFGRALLPTSIAKEMLPSGYQPNETASGITRFYLLALECEDAVVANVSRGRAHLSVAGIPISSAGPHNETPDAVLAYAVDIHTVQRSITRLFEEAGGLVVDGTVNTTFKRIPGPIEEFETWVAVRRGHVYSVEAYGRGAASPSKEVWHILAGDDPSSRYLELTLNGTRTDEYGQGALVGGFDSTLAATAPFNWFESEAVRLFDHEIGLRLVSP
ncbi:MAG: hypothetical protein HYT80_03140 [Euryarchaeota archaeon]|nr:hypothetical protein [Euryarchaeota archaeon]